MSVLRVKDVQTKIGHETVLDQISFELESASVTALVGHNGAGKSTLMKTILHMLDKTEGEIVIQNTYSQDEELIEFKKHLAYLPEEPMLLMELTMMQHFQLYGMSYGVDEAVLQERIQYYIKGFELVDKLHEYPDSLSKGMRQKVQTICALIPDVALLLIDEPFIGLDIYGMDFLEKEIRRKVAQGTAILLTSHQLERVKDLANHYIMLQQGRIESMGPINEFETIERRTK